LSSTDEVVTFIRTATPPRAARERAAAELDRFQRTAAANTESPVPSALRAIAPRPVSPLWMAWVSGAAAASASGPQEWTPICAATLAVCADGDRAAEAAAIGREVADRVAATLGDTHTAAGWYAPATAGTIGAVAAAGRALGLTAEQLRNAIGIGATQAAGLAGAIQTDANPVQIGKAAANAVEAALLGRNGFTSSAQPLEGRRGMFALMSARADVTVMTEGLGDGNGAYPATVSG
jgi:2-methylcitrate dehydratase MmgE/PrpD-like protein